MILSLSKKFYIKKQNFTPGLFLLSLLTATLLLSDIVITSTALLSTYERATIHTIALILSILLFITIFWKETGGDFFSFINIILIGYIIMFVMPILFLLYLPQTHTRPGYWIISSIEYSIWIVIISLYSLVFGYKLAIGSRARIILPLSLRPSIKRMAHVIFICVGLYLIYLFVKSFAMGASIWDLFAYHPRGSEYTRREYRMGIYTLINLLRYGPGYIFLLCFLLPRDKGIKKGSLLCANLFILCYILNTLFSGIIGLGKSTVVGLVFFILALIHYTRRKVRFIEIVAISLIGISVLTIFNYRRIAPEHRYVLNKINVIPRMYTQSFEDFETLCAVVSHFPRAQQYYYGQRLFEEVVYLPIPRAFWKEKPAAYGSRAILYDISPNWFFSGYHTGLQSQFYADFGLAGVVIGFVVFGWLIGWIYKIFRQNFSNKGIILMYIVIVSNFWLFLKGGFPWLNLAITSYIPFYILLCYIYPIKIKPNLKDVSNQF